MYQFYLIIGMVNAASNSFGRQRDRRHQAALQHLLQIHSRRPGRRRPRSHPLVKSPYGNSFAGKSRSSSVVVAYLMKEWHMSFDQALKAVQAKRPVVEPNNNFVKQLREYEEEVMLEEAESKTVAEEESAPN
eukprot:TRINITY_DN7855_c0_g2_i1.p1 TRINITY_DN7855_c0_g2~~TRINITY_DN7855_c0_g2_i1.p1  ORF type:complete len:132 (-),score=18.46 TRINITY_DN7855_c0_g2_i1:48-443(-)